MNRMRSLLFLLFFLSDGTLSQTIQWERLYGSPSDEMGFDLLSLSSNGFVIVGYRGSPQRTWLLRLGSSGDTLWTKEYNTIGPTQAMNVVEAPDNGLLIVSNLTLYQFPNSIENVHIIRTNSTGDTIWVRLFTSGVRVRATGLIRTSGNSYLVIGTVMYGDSSKMWLLSIDDDGNRIWEKSHKRGTFTYGKDVVLNVQGEPIALGGFNLTDSAGSPTPVWIAKIAGNGDIVSDRSYMRNNRQYGQNIIRTSDGNLLVIGDTHDPVSDDDLWLLKLNSQCDTVWTKTYPAPLRDIGLKVKELPDSSFICVGYRHPPANTNACDILITKFNPQGNKTSEYLFGNQFQEIGNNIIQTGTHDFVVLGNRYDNIAWQEDIWLFSFREDNTSVGGQFPNALSFALHDNFPNPFNPSTAIRYQLSRRSYVRLNVYGMLGNDVSVLVNEVQEAGFKEIGFDATGLPSGVYFYRLIADGRTITKKMLLLK